MGGILGGAFVSAGVKMRITLDGRLKQLSRRADIPPH
jgi:hypothetical protein